MAKPVHIIPATFEGFRLVGRRPGLFAAWCGIYVGMFVLAMIAVLAIMYIVGGGSLESFAQTMQGFEGGAPWAPFVGLVVVLPVIFLLGAMWSAAIFRAVTTRDPPGFAYFRIGADEFRIAVVFLVQTLVLIPILIVSVAVGAAIGYASGETWSGLALLVAALLIGWLWTRLSFGAVMTFAERRIRIFQSWTFTRGRNLPLLGMYLMLLLIILGLNFTSVLLGGSSRGGLAGGGSVASAALASLLYLLLAPVIGVLQMVLVSAPQAKIYNDARPTDVSVF